jgi:hypothetical protein
MALGVILWRWLPAGAGGMAGVALTSGLADHLHLMKDSFL